MIPINQMLQIRAKIIALYKRYESIILPIVKFICILMVFLLINKNLGYSSSINKFSVTLTLSLVGVFLSAQLVMLLFIFVTAIHIGVASLEMGIVIFAVFIIIYLLFIRLYPKESLFILGTIVAYKLHIPYIVPLIAGLFSSLASVVGLIIGIIIWYCAPQVINMMQGESAKINDIVEVINKNILALQQTFKADKTMLASIIILATVLITIYLIKKQSVDYSAYIAILVGSVMNVVGFLISIILFKVDVSPLFLILFTLIASLIALVLQFFSKVVDYSRAENVQFEDSKNYYYVKVVPKIKLNETKKQFKYNYTEDD